MLNQVSVFAENTKGALRKMTSVLADANINIYTMLANDSAEFGIIRLIVTNPELAVSKLQEAGYQCHMDKVVAVEMGDTPGCLDKILDSLRQANISIDYLYISYNRQAGTPVAIFRPAKWKRKRSCAVKDMYCWIRFKKKSCRMCDSSF